VVMDRLEESKTGKLAVAVPEVLDITVEIWAETPSEAEELDDTEVEDPEDDMSELEDTTPFIIAQRQP